MKKTTIGAVALALCTLFAVFCFTGCNSESSSSNTEMTAAATTAQETTSAAAKSELTGSWDSQEAPGTVYTFNVDGTGQLSFDDIISKFTFTEKDGKITLTYEDVAAPQTFEYSVKDGVPSMTDEYGATITYAKK